MTSIADLLNPVDQNPPAKMPVHAKREIRNVSEGKRKYVDMTGHFSMVFTPRKAAKAASRQIEHLQKAPKKTGAQGSYQKVYAAIKKVIDSVAPLPDKKSRIKKLEEFLSLANSNSKPYAGFLWAEIMLDEEKVSSKQGRQIFAYLQNFVEDMTQKLDEEDLYDFKDFLGRAYLYIGNILFDQLYGYKYTKEQVEKYYLKSKQFGNYSAYIGLGNLYEYEEEYDKALDIWKKCKGEFRKEKEKVAPVLNRLGCLYAEGFEDFKEAVKILQQAAELGDEDAKFNLPLYQGHLENKNAKKDSLNFLAEAADTAYTAKAKTH
ncbi:MAG: hypothetical protein Tsb0015_08230 [Simkaniaceae bacterium]